MDPVALSTLVGVLGGTPSGRLDGTGGTPSGRLDGTGGTPSGRLDGTGGTPSGRLDGTGGTPSGRLDGTGGTPSGRLDGTGGTPSGRLDGTGGTPSGRLDGTVTAEHATIHSGRIHRGSVFFALAGTRADGHDFVEQAVANGAVAAVVRRGRFQGGSGLPLIEVRDPLTALQSLASWWRDQLEAEVVAVVGSNGKTVTKDAIVHFAGAGRAVYGSPGSYNSQLGVALAVLDCPRRAGLAVIEAAVSWPGEMARLQGLLRPDRVVLTNLGARWASQFDDRAHQGAELLTMAGRLGPGDWLLVGEDAPELAGGAGAARRLVTNRSPDLPRFSAAQPGPDGLTVGVGLPGGYAGSLTVRTPSEEILLDVETAVTAAWLLGLDGPTLIEAAREYTPTSTRMEIWKSPSGVTVVRDVVTPDPIAVASAVRAARRLVAPGQRCVVVLSEPFEHTGAEEAAAFARALHAEGADVVHALDVASHRRVVAAVPAGGVEVRMAAGVDELRQALLAELVPGDVVLVQSAPASAIGDLAVSLMESMAPTRVYLDLAAIEDNVTTFRRLVGPSVRIMGMVKALAYGTDAPNISACLQAAGVDALGVSGVDEGIALRRAGIGVPVLVLLGTPGEIGKMLRHRLTPMVYAPDLLEAVLAEAASAGPELAVHVEVDSGMHRTGFPPGPAVEAIERLAASTRVRVTGLMTHLACADDPAEDAATREQLRRFRSVSDAVDRLGLAGVVRHAASTAATIRLPESHFDMVRVGLGLYGVYLAPEMADQVKLQQAIGLVSRLVEVVAVPEGERVGYGGTFTAPAGGTRVGVVPVGYHDGVPRSASNEGWALVAGTRCRIVGRVSMDSMTVDLSPVPDAAAGADVLVYGKHHDWSLPVEELAGASGTIAHEVMARIGPRVQRIFTRY